MKLRKLTESYSVVLLGAFNPLLFHPFWLKEKGIISNKDIRLDNDNNEFVVHQQMTSFPVGDWLNVIVKQQRAEFRIEDAAKLVLLRDLVIGVLNALPDVPIISFGINHGVISTLDNQEDYYKFGQFLTPLDNWKDSFNAPKLSNLSILDEHSELLSTKLLRIQPASYNDIPYCVDINMNYHYNMPKENQKSLFAASIIAENITPCMQDYDNIVGNLMSKLP